MPSKAERPTEPQRVFFDDSRSTFCRRRKCPRRSKRPVGRPTYLTNAEEQPLVNAILEFSGTGTPFSGFSIVAQTRLFTDNLPTVRQNAIGFVNNTPGKDYIAGLFRRYPRVTLRSEQALEKCREDAMSVDRIAAHFARLTTLMSKYGISSPDQILMMMRRDFLQEMREYLGG